MAPDFPVELINATVQLEQDQGDNTKTVGTGFLVSAPTPDGKPRTVLITAGHLLERMPRPDVSVGWRMSLGGGGWRYAPGPVTIRAALATEPTATPAAAAVPVTPAYKALKSSSLETAPVEAPLALPVASPKPAPRQYAPLWVRHPTQDIAAIAIKAPPEFAKAAIPLSWLADDATFARYGVQPGDEMMALGFPRGLSSNKAGFPILRWGRVASYPLEPVTNFPTFLLDFRVFDGNSGGPVFMADPGRGASGAGAYFVAGVLTRQVESRGDRLEIGIVVHARHVREAIALLDRRAPPARAAPVKTATPVGTQPDKVRAK